MLKPEKHFASLGNVYHARAHNLAGLAGQGRALKLHGAGPGLYQAGNRAQQREFCLRRWHQ